MALDKVQVWNRALGRIAGGTVASENEQSMAARYCRLFYQEVIDNMLQGPAHFSFATQRVELTQALVNPRYEWRFAYQLPSNVGGVLRVLPDLTETGIVIPPIVCSSGWGQFLDEMASEYILDGDLIFCNEPEAILEYTISDIDSLRVSPMVARAIEIELASLLASSPVKKDKQLATSLAQEAELAWSRAIADDRNRQPEQWGNYESETLIARHADMCHFHTSRKDTTPVTTTPTTPVVPTGPVSITCTSAPVASGTTTVGSTVSCTTGIWTGGSAVFTYQWRADGVDILGATGSTFILTVAQYGHNVNCAVLAAGATSPAVSNTIGVVTGVAPVNTVAPVIAGTATVGQVLTRSSPGTWTGTAPITYTDQWKRDGVDITGATGSTYTLVTADIGKTITDAVTATNVVTGVAALSNSIGPVADVGISTPSLDFDVASGWVTGQNPPKLVLTLPSDGTVHMDDWIIRQYSASSTFVSGVTEEYHQLTSADILSGTATFTFGSIITAGLKYFREAIGRGTPGSFTSVSGWSTPTISDTLSASAATTVLTTVTGNDKSSAVSVTGTPALASQGTASVGAHMLVRATQAANNNKYQFEVKLIALNSSSSFNFEFGLDDGVLAFTATNAGYRPGDSGTYSAAGISVQSVSSGQIIYQGGTNSNEVVHTPVVNDVYSVVVDRSGASGTHTFTVYFTHSGTTTQVLQRTGLTIPSTWRAFASHVGDDKIQFNFGQNTFARTLGGGEAMYG